MIFTYFYKLFLKKILSLIKYLLFGRVADPVHFRPDPDPANQNFKTGSGSRILLALQKSIQTSTFFHIKHISSDIWMMIIFIWKNGKIHQKMCKSSIFKIFFPWLYNFKLYIAKVLIGSGSGENFPDPAPDPNKKVRIRPYPEPWRKGREAYFFSLNFCRFSHTHTPEWIRSLWSNPDLNLDIAEG